MCGHCLIVLPLLKLRNTVTSLLTSWVQNKYRSDTVATLFFSDCRRRRPSKTGLSRPSEIEVLAGRPKRRSKKAKRNRCQSCQAEFVFSSVVCLMLVTGMWGGRWGYVLVNDQIYLLQVIHKTDFTLVATKTAQGIVFVAVYIYIYVESPSPIVVTEKLSRAKCTWWCGLCTCLHTAAQVGTFTLMGNWANDGAPLTGMDF